MIKRAYYKNRNLMFVLIIIGLLIMLLNMKIVSLRYEYKIIDSQKVVATLTKQSEDLESNMEEQMSSKVLREKATALGMYFPTSVAEYENFADIAY